MTTTTDTTPTIADLVAEIAELRAAVTKVTTSTSHAWDSILAIEGQIERQSKIAFHGEATDHAGFTPTKQQRLLIDELIDWRLQTFRATGIKAHHILTNASVESIAKELPSDRYDLMDISGVGVKTIELYGDAILDIVQRHCEAIRAGAD